MPDITAPAAATALPPFALGSDWAGYIDANPTTWPQQLAAVYGPGNSFEGQTISGYRFSRAGGLELWLGAAVDPVPIPGTAC